MLILVVEDEAINAKIIEIVLTQEGHTVLGPVASSVDALRLARDTRPDFAIVDVHLRDGEAGVALARLLLEHWNVPSIFASADRAPSARNDGVGIGHLGKPYTAEALAAAVQRACALVRDMTGTVPPAAVGPMPAKPPCGQ